MQTAHFGLRIREVPASCRYFDDASSVRFRAGVVYGLKTLWAGVRLMLHRADVLRCKKYMKPGRGQAYAAGDAISVQSGGIADTARLESGAPAGRQ